MATFFNETNFLRLIKIGKEMRGLQRKYFKGDKSVLEACKAKEKEYDLFVKSIEDNEAEVKGGGNSKQLTL